MASAVIGRLELGQGLSPHRKTPLETKPLWSPLAFVLNLHTHGIQITWEGGWLVFPSFSDETFLLQWLKRNYCALKLSLCVHTCVRVCMCVINVGYLPQLLSTLRFEIGSLSLCLEFTSDWIGQPGSSRGPSVSLQQDYRHGNTMPSFR